MSNGGNYLGAKEIVSTTATAEMRGGRRSLTGAASVERREMEAEEEWLEHGRGKREGGGGAGWSTNLLDPTTTTLDFESREPSPPNSLF